MSTTVVRGLIAELDGSYPTLRRLCEAELDGYPRNDDIDCASYLAATTKADRVEALSELVARGHTLDRISGQDLILYHTHREDIQEQEAMIIQHGLSNAMPSQGRQRPR